MEAAGPWVQQWLSSPRFDPYLKATGGDVDEALELYVGNAKLAGALLVDIGHVEVALRNSYNVALERRFGAEPHWTSRIEEVLGSSGATKGLGRLVTSQSACTVAPDSDQPISMDSSASSSDRVISKLSLGFWVSMTSAVHEQRLWIPAIRHAFASPPSRVDAHRTMTELRSIRNRAAHQDSLLGLDVRSAHVQLLDFAQALQPSVSEVIAAMSDVPLLLNRYRAERAKFR